MSARLQDITVPSDWLDFWASDTTVYATISDNGQAEVAVARADFLAAVAAECNVIVIDRNDLSKVSFGADEDGDPRWSAGDSTWTFARGQTPRSADLRSRALDSLALAEYLDAHPPVDEADVEALASALKDEPLFGLGRPDANEVARHLLATGRVQVTR